MDIRITDFENKLTYILNLEYRVTIIEGNSATGKTELIRRLDDSENRQISVTSPMPIMHINSKVLRLTKTLRDDIIYIMDENDNIEDHDMVNIINNSKCKFILITRNTTLPNINYGIRQIYYFRNSGKYNILTKLYNIDNSNVDISKLQSIITEDSGSGKKFYEKTLNMSILSSNGNSNITNYMSNNQCIIIDELGFGPYIKLVYRKLKNNNIALIYPRSFEYLILISGILGLMSNFDDNYDINHAEKYYYKKLREICQEYNLKYNKGDLDDWFLVKSQSDKIISKIHELFGIDLRNINRCNTNNYFNWG